MTPLNEFLEKNSDRMNQFLQQCATSSSSLAPAKASPRNRNTSLTDLPYFHSTSSKVSKEEYKEAIGLIAVHMNRNMAKLSREITLMETQSSRSIGTVSCCYNSDNNYR